MSSIDKIDRLVRVMSKDLQFATESSGSSGSAAPMKLFKSKLKIMVDKLKNAIISQADNQKTNLLIKCTCEDILPYITPTTTQDGLVKLIMAKYPKFGYHLLQELEDISSLNVEQIKLLYQSSAK